MSFNPVELEVTNNPEPAAGGEIAATGSPWRLVWRTFRQNKLALLGLILIVALIPIFTFQRVEGRIFRPMALTFAGAKAVTAQKNNTAQAMNATNAANIVAGRTLAAPVKQTNPAHSVRV